MLGGLVRAPLKLVNNSIASKSYATRSGVRMVAGPGCCGPPVLRNGHPKWSPPTSGEDLGLKINNSLTSQSEKFIPMNGRQVKMYLCGPTVYDMSHVGHARTYLTFDIMRRIMEEYFGYDVMFQVNITDIDDKIIMRARQNHLVAQYVEQNKGDRKKVVEDCDAAMLVFSKKLDAKLEELNVPSTDPRVEAERVEKLKEQTFKIEQHKEFYAKFQDLVKDSKNGVDEIVAAAKDQIAGKLDDELKHTVTDNKVFEAHARKYEKLFLEDLVALGIKAPDCLTRITEYVPGVVSFCEKIVNKGLAYESHGSIYFDTQKFKEAGHDYPKLVPTAGRATAAEQQESEGALSSAFQDEKKHPNDFALWKKSKPGECKWDSPWGEGRPGWHIECSVMASEIIGERMDIHGGGSDLKFPHHDNECAQSEAFWGTDQWVNYFAHTGHLHIKGLKMSKSLKNFITIRQSLEIYTARQIRIMFLMVGWDKPMEYSDKTLQAACTREQKFNAFFGAIKTLLRNATNEAEPRSQKWGKEELALNEYTLKCQGKVREALSDNFDYPTAMLELNELMTEVNKYITEVGEDKANPPVVAKAAQFVTRMLRIFGVAECEEIGLGAAGGGNAEEAVAPIMDAFAEFREIVRNEAKAAKVSSLLKACDEVRDVSLVNAGIRLEDRPGQTAAWRMEDAEALKKEMAEKEARKAEEMIGKIENKVNLAQAELKKFTEASLPPKEQLLNKNKDKYKDFDASTGYPTLTIGDEEISKKAKKGLEADMKKMEKAHADFQAKAEKEGGAAAFLAKLEENVRDLEAQLEKTKALATGTK